MINRHSVNIKPYVLWFCNMMMVRIAHYCRTTFVLLLLTSFSAFTTQAATDCSLVTTEIPQTECEALLALYQQTDGPNWLHNDGWNETLTPCDWYGITCDDSLGSVFDIDLSYNRLRGNLPDFSDLSELGLLILRGNQLTGSVLSRHLPAYLETLDLADNALSGPLPDLSHLSFLYMLDCAHNQFTGSISSADFPPEIEDIYLDHNQFTGAVPDLTAFRYLMSFSAAHNQLQGNLSRSYLPETLVALYLDHNQLTGTIPELTHLTTLHELNLSHNQLTGPIPKLPLQLATLALEHNQLAGSFDLNELTQLQTLNLAYNQLSGSFPELTALTHLSILDLSFNQFQGKIPFSLLTLSKELIILKLEHNYLTTFNSTLIDFLNSRDPRWFYQINNNESPIELPYNLITITKAGSGDGFITDQYQLHCGSQCSAVYEYGHIMTLKVTPQPGYTFVGWEECPETFAVTQPQNCTAIFEPKPAVLGTSPLPSTMTLTVKTAGSGSGWVYSEPGGIDCAECQHTYKTASWLDLIAQAGPDSEFIGWGGHSDCSDGHVYLVGNRLCIAFFKQLYPLTLSTVGHGHVSGAGIDCGKKCWQRYRDQSTVTLIATAAPGAQFSHWQGDCQGKQNPLTLTLTAATQCSAHFEPVLELLPNPQTPQGLLELHEQAVTEAPQEVIQTIPAQQPAEEVLETEPPPAESLPPESLALNSQTMTAATVPPCPPRGYIDFICLNHGRTITDAVLGPNAYVAGGHLAGHIDNEGMISQVTIEPGTVVSGGKLSGYIVNQGTLIDFEFVGAEIEGGQLGGIVYNHSPIGGTLKNVALAAETYLSGGRLQGNVQGVQSAPALLEHVVIQANSHLQQVLIGDQVSWIEPVRLSEGVIFLNQ